MSVRSYGLLFRSLLYKRFVLTVRYPVNTTSQFGMVLLLFLIIFYGGQAVAGAAITQSIEGIVVGYFLWTMAVGAYSALAWSLTREAQWGTLEQLYASPFGFGRVTTVKLVAHVLESFGYGAIMLAVMLLLTGRTLSVDLLTVVPLVVLALASAVGVGFLIAGLTLVYKRVENVFALVQFVFIGFIAAPVDQYPALEAVPLSLGSALLRQAMQDGASLTTLPAGDLAALVVKALLYLVAGFLVFRYLVGVAKDRGVLGHY